LLDQVIEKNKNTVKIVIKNYPLKMHSYARNAAAASLAAASMGKFWEFHEALFKNKKLDDKKLREMVASFGFDPDEFENKMKSKEIQNKIDQDKLDGKKAGISGTPTIFINGKLLRNRSLKGFQDMIDSELKKSK
jgi:protein-disulfide isomerase